MRSGVKKCMITVTVAALLLATLSGATMETWATTIKDVENAIENTQNQLDEINGNISDMEDQQDLLEEQMEDLNAEIINILASIDILEEDIAQKKRDIAQKEEDIVLTQQAYEEALQREEDQAAAMALQIQFMYETGEETWMNMLLNNSSFSDMLNSVSLPLFCVPPPSAFSAGSSPAAAEPWSPRLPVWPWRSVLQNCRTVPEAWPPAHRNIPSAEGGGTQKRGRETPSGGAGCGGQEPSPGYEQYQLQLLCR